LSHEPSEFQESKIFLVFGRFPDNDRSDRAQRDQGCSFSSLGPLAKLGAAPQHALL